MFLIGVLEVALCVLLAVAAVAFRLLRLAQARWLTALTICVAVASCLTPADLVSTVIVAAALFGCFYAGTKFPTASLNPEG